MPLVVENGSGVLGANTFASLEDLTAYATARGITLPATDTGKEQLLILSADAIASLEQTYIGMRTHPEQDLSWPRTDPCRSDGSILLDNGQIVSATAIPKQLIAAQCQLACDQQQAAFFQVSDGRIVTEETVGPITTKYADTTGGGSDGSTINFQKFEAILAILQKALAFSITTVRV